MTGFSEDPQSAYGRPLDKKAFLHWVQRQQYKYEFKNGEAVMHPGGTRKHAQIIGHFIVALGNRLDPKAWAVGPGEFAVAIGEDVRFPDILVERASSAGDALSTEEPVVLVEVLSPSSKATDMTIKLAEYTSLASLEAYIVASQDEPIVWVWQRDPSSRAFPAQPIEISGRDQSIEISALELTLPLAELFRSIV